MANQPSQNDIENDLKMYCEVAGFRALVKVFRSRLRSDVYDHDSMIRTHAFLSSEAKRLGF